LLPALAGANVIYGLGNTESGITMDYGQLVMDNEFAGMVKFILGGIPVNDDTLAVDVIHEVGQSRDFLSLSHTLTHMRTAQTHPELIDRRNRVDWKGKGGTTIYERAWKKAEHILDTHKPKPLSPDVKAALRDIVAETEEKFGVKK
jgi:trimethylamine--corrinoid protein Co-methyltransferase